MTNVPEPTSWAESIAAELRSLADDFAKAAVDGLPIPRSIGLNIQPGGPQGAADDQVIATVDALGHAVLGKSGKPEEMSPRGSIFHYNVEGGRGPIVFSVYREISTARVDQMKAGEVLAAKERELARLRAEVEQLRADRGLTYSREADDPTPVSPARVPPHTGAVTDEGLVDESEPVHMVLADGARYCGRTGPGSLVWREVTCSDCIGKGES